jgi:hypothetical protein
MSVGEITSKFVGVRHRRNGSIFIEYYAKGHPDYDMVDSLSSYHERCERIEYSPGKEWVIIYNRIDSGLISELWHRTSECYLFYFIDDGSKGNVE